jgi:DNA-binding FadR family transcriptional regulator
MSTHRSHRSEIQGFLDRPVTSPNVFEETVERLGACIKTGLFRPGERLPPEREIADLIGVSRTTVRHALHVLAAGNFVESRRGRHGGTFVAGQPPSWEAVTAEEAVRQNAQSLEELVAYRRVIEMGTAELAAEHATAGQIEDLRAIVAEMPEAGRQQRTYRIADVRLHLNIARAAHCPPLFDLVASIQEKSSDLMNCIPFTPEACAHSSEQHHQIVEAISAGDGEMARRIMREHIDGTMRMLRGLLPESSPADLG